VPNIESISNYWNFTGHNISGCASRLDILRLVQKVLKGERI
jgi:hypothetical protein